MGEWAPANARIAALIFGHHAPSQSLLAVKIEYVREFLLDVIRHEAAYYRSRERQTQPWDMLSDWLWAEQTITGIE
jgi:hypothetical protein